MRFVYNNFKHLSGPTSSLFRDKNRAQVRPTMALPVTPPGPLPFKTRGGGGGGGGRVTYKDRARLPPLVSPQRPSNQVVPTRGGYSGGGGVPPPSPPPPPPPMTITITIYPFD